MVEKAGVKLIWAPSGCTKLRLILRLNQLKKHFHNYLKKRHILSSISVDDGEEAQEDPQQHRTGEDFKISGWNHSRVKELVCMVERYYLTMGLAKLSDVIIWKIHQYLN